MSTIEQLQEHGIALREIHADLVQSGLKLTFGSFENALSRIRKRRKQAVEVGSPSQVAYATNKKPQTRTEQPASFQSAGSRSMAERGSTATAQSLSPTPKPLRESAEEIAQRRTDAETFQDKLRRYHAAQEAGPDPGPFNAFK